MAGGRVEEFDGDLDAYAAWLRSRPATNGEAKAKAVEKPAPKAAARTAPDPAIARRLRRIEARLEQVRSERAEVEQALADPDLYTSAGHERLAELGIRQAELAREQDDLEIEWLDLA